MPSRSQVLRLLSDGLDYEEAGRRLGVPAGQAFLIATGLPADSGDTSNPTTKESVRRWLRERALGNARMRRAAEARDAAPGGERVPEGTRELSTVLTRDHDRVGAMVKELQALPGPGEDGSPARSARRRSVADMIADAMATHTPAERQHLWPVVRDTLDDGDRIADQALDAADESTRTLDELRRAAADSEEFDELVERYALQSRRRTALVDSVLLRLREALSREERERLGAEVAHTLEYGPTRQGQH